VGWTQKALPVRVASVDLKHLLAEFLDDPYPTYRALREFDPHPSDVRWLLFPDTLRRLSCGLSPAVKQLV
jgi:hypothetical protein